MRKINGIDVQKLEQSPIKKELTKLLVNNDHGVTSYTLSMFIDNNKKVFRAFKYLFSHRLVNLSEPFTMSTDNICSAAYLVLGDGRKIVDKLKDAKEIDLFSMPRRPEERGFSIEIHGFVFDETSSEINIRMKPVKGLYFNGFSAYLRDLNDLKPSDDIKYLDFSVQKACTVIPCLFKVLVDLVDDELIAKCIHKLDLETEEKSEQIQIKGKSNYKDKWGGFA